MCQNDHIYIIIIERFEVHHSAVKPSVSSSYDPKKLSPYRAENPFVFVAPEFGIFQYLEPLVLSLPPACLYPPEKRMSLSYYFNEGTCHPAGHTPLGSDTAAQL